MPAAWTLEADGADVSAVVRQRLRIVRGHDVGPTAITPRAGVATFVVDDDSDIEYGDDLTIQAGSIAVLDGVVRDVSPGTDRGTGIRHFGVHVDGAMAQIVGAGSGFGSEPFADIAVHTAIGYLLDAIGLASSRRDIGVSGRRLDTWFIEEDVPIWQQLFTLVRTAGPSARLWERPDGRLAFRDPSAASPPTWTLRSRLVAGAGAIVSAVDNEESGRDRIVNSVSIPFLPSSALAAQRVATLSVARSPAR